MSLDADKGRLISLSFKKSTQGLTPEEEQEMQMLKDKIALAKAQGGKND